MKVAVFGLWHLGSVTAACTAAAGVTTVAIDLDRERDRAALRPASRRCPSRGSPNSCAPASRAGTLALQRRRRDACRTRTSSGSAYDTPVDDDDRADVDAVRRRGRDAVSASAGRRGGAGLVAAAGRLGRDARSSVSRLEPSGRTVAFACSPENLRLGKAIEVFRTRPHHRRRARQRERARSSSRCCANSAKRSIWMSVESAEMIKHALNAFLAMSVTFANEIATLCEHVGADAAEVERGLRSEPRIGPSAYVARRGRRSPAARWRATCSSFARLAHEHGLALPVMDGDLASNRAHGQWALPPAQPHLAAARRNARSACLGLAYKPGTNTLRRSPRSSCPGAAERWRARAGVRSARVEPAGRAEAGRGFAPTRARPRTAPTRSWSATSGRNSAALSADDVAGAMKAAASCSMPAASSPPRSAPTSACTLISVGRDVMKPRGPQRAHHRREPGLGRRDRRAFVGRGAAVMLCARDADRARGAARDVCRRWPDPRPHRCAPRRRVGARPMSTLCSAPP